MESKNNSTWRDLTCPECKSRRIVYAGTSLSGIGGYEATDARYSCQDCGYTGPLIIDVTEEEASKENDEVKNIPAIVFILLLISFLIGAYSGIYTAIMSFLVLILLTAAVLKIFSLKSGNVMDDLKEMREEEKKKEKKGSEDDNQDIPKK